MALYGIIFSAIGGIAFPVLLAGAGAAAMFYLRSPRLALCLVAAAGIWFGVGQVYQAGVAAESTKNRILELEAKNRILKTDLDLTRSAAETANAQAAALTEDLASKERELDALEAELAQRPDAGNYRATDADLKRVFLHRR